MEMWVNGGMNEWTSNVWWCKFVRWCNFVMFTKRCLHDASSLQTSGNAIDNNLVNISFHLILFSYILTAISIWITASKSGYHENGLLVNMQNMCFAKCCCFACLIFNPCGPNAVDLWLLWFHNCPQGVSLATPDGSIHYLFRNALLKKVTKLHHLKYPIWRNYITPSILVMQFRHSWCKFIMMLTLNTMTCTGALLVCLLRIVVNEYHQNNATNMTNILQTKMYYYISLN